MRQDETPAPAPEETQNAPETAQAEDAAEMLKEGPPPFEMTTEGLSETATYYGAQILDTAIVFAPKLLAAGLVIWIGSHIAERLFGWAMKRTTESGRVDTTLGNFFASVLRYAVMAGVLLLAVSILGVNVASIFVVFSAMTLAIGLALQGSMSNVAAGLVLIILRPYRVGDFVELVGEEGTVEDVNIFTTTLRTLDNIKVIMANGDVRSNTIRNFTSLGMRRVDVDFGIDYGDDVAKAIKIINETAGKHPQVDTAHAEPWAKVSCLNDSSVDIQMRVWCKPEHYWDVRFDLLRSVKEAFDAGGITIPYPHVVEIEKRV